MSGTPGQFNLRQLLLIMLAICAALAWFRERQLREQAIAPALHNQVRSLTLDLSSRLDQRTQENRRLDASISHLRNRLLRANRNPHRRNSSDFETIAARADLLVVQQVPDYSEPLTWKFRAHVPPDSEQQLFIQLGGVAPDAIGPSRGNSESKSVPGPVVEYEDRIEIALDNPRGQWQLTVTAGDRRVAAPLAFDISFGRSVDLARKVTQLAIVYPDNESPQTAAIDERLELFRLSNDAPLDGEIGGETGIVVYFEPPPPSPDPVVSADPISADPASADPARAEEP